jgi:hypothetical protein
MTSVRTIWLVATSGLVAWAVPPAWAQDAAAPPSVERPPTPADQAEIEKALQDDSDAAQAAPTQAPPTPPADPGGGRQLLHALNPDISLITDVALAWFSRPTNLQTGGHDPNKRGFNLQQVEMSIQKSVDPYFRFDSFIVFSQFGVEVEEAYATTLALPANLQVRAGQFLTRFGRINPTHPHAWDFVDQPFALGRVFGGEGNRGLGVELSYLVPLPWYVELVSSVTDPAGAATARSFYGATDLGLRTPLDFQGTLALKQFFPLSDDWSLLWGLSAAGGPNPTGHGNRSEVYGTDVYLKYRPITQGGNTAVSLQSEWFYRRRQVPEDVLQDVNGYAYVFWRFALRWGAAVRYEHGSPTWAMTGRNPTDYLDLYWTDHRHRASANVTFWPTEFSRVRLQGSCDVLGWDNSATWASFLAFEVVVGAHGAHRF